VPSRRGDDRRDPNIQRRTKIFQSVALKCVCESCHGKKKQKRENVGCAGLAGKEDDIRLQERAIRKHRMHDEVSMHITSEPCLTVTGNGWVSAGVVFLARLMRDRRKQIYM
jgi:hypothetical protein